MRERGEGEKAGENEVRVKRKEEEYREGEEGRGTKKMGRRKGEGMVVERGMKEEGGGERRKRGMRA